VRFISFISQWSRISQITGHFASQTKLQQLKVRFH